MKIPLAANMAMAVAAALPVAAIAETENFDRAAAGSLPAGWISGVTGRGTPKWQVIADPTAPSAPHVLNQSGSGTFPWAVKQGVVLADGYVETRFKSISGKEDQAGGVVWRWQGTNTYYVARANANEDNVSLYYTTGGSRTTIKYVNAPVPRNVWHTLRVEFNGSSIRVIFNGKTCIEADDTHIREPGAVGLWTKADSVTSFDDFSFGTKSEGK
ncbi:MAG: DUF1080 domain-containing protein [Burkholderiales bacterium]|nr:DUF1080 domain-containing protein [Burkholderiales bacterium]